MNSPLTPRDIAAMTAHAAGIKAENARHGAEPWAPSADSGCWNVVNDSIGTSCYRTIRDANGQIVAFAVAFDPNPFAHVDCRDNLRRIVACVNACAGVPTETLELAASWGDIVKGVMGGARISAEAARIGAGLDGDSLEQGDPSCI
jgi:hypothetical protein